MCAYRVGRHRLTAGRGGWLDGSVVVFATFLQFESDFTSLLPTEGFSSRWEVFNSLGWRGGYSKGGGSLQPHRPRDRHKERWRNVIAHIWLPLTLMIVAQERGRLAIHSVCGPVPSGVHYPE